MGAVCYLTDQAIKKVKETGIKIIAHCLSSIQNQLMGLLFLIKKQILVDISATHICFTELFKMCK